MKSVLLATFFAFISSTSFAISWEPNCGASYKKDFLKPNYTFHVKHGEVGGCKSDSLEQYWSPTANWKWSERKEVMSSGRIGKGKYVWSATIDIERNCQPAYRNTLFQLHAGEYMTPPPSFLGINKYNQFRTNQSSTSIGPVPEGPFEVIAEMSITDDRIDVDYYINGKYLTTTVRVNESGKPYRRLFMKFGVYRVNSNCDITQKYYNVKFSKKTVDKNK